MIITSRCKIIYVVFAIFFFGVTYFIFTHFTPYYRNGYQTLDITRKHGDLLDEFIKSENENMHFPQYTQYYEKSTKETPSRRLIKTINYFGYKIGFLRAPAFSPSYFNYLLNSLLETRKKHSLEGPVLQRVDLKFDSKVVVFGSIQGAFHPMLRYLEKLHELNIIDQNFKLSSKSDYIVFLGNVVNRSPYTLEIFTLILKLMDANPGKIFFLRGRNEYYNYWKQHSLREELEVRLKIKPMNNVIPLKDEVEAFFASLPLAIYFTLPENSVKDLNYFIARPSLADSRYPKMIENLNISIFKQSKKLDGIPSVKFEDHKNSKFGSQKPKNLRAVVQDIRKKLNYEKMNGLRLLSYENNTAYWTVLSTSAESYRELLGYYYDAFTIIEYQKARSSWVINLFNRDIRNATNKFTKSSFSLLTTEKIIN